MNKSTLERAVALTNTQLRRSNQALRKNLKRIVELSTENERTQERMDIFEEVVYETASLKEMFDSMITQGRRIFDIPYITVALEEGYGRFYPDEYKKNGRRVFLESKNMIFAPTAGLSANFPQEPRLALRGNLKEGTEFFFPAGISQKIRSEALAPLFSARGELLGVLCFGSPAPDRFLEGYGGRFLERLSRLVSLKMELFTAAEGPLAG
ncbi:MAG: DUF484 family protein [Nitrospinota bacterium]|nr:DUF484 family protein [Nitrospinota bacterium]